MDVYIPTRKNEGYGLNSEAINHLYAQGTRLLVTVDCGISGHAEVEGAPSGLDIIITDHHTVGGQLPAAYAIVNPHQKGCRYPFKDLAGVGVAFKLCQALYMRLTHEAAFWQEHLELVALGTVADIVPLLGENRVLVRRGLSGIRQTDSLGLRALLEVSGVVGKCVTGETVGFVLAPRLNSVGRLEDAMLAVELLTTEEKKRAAEIAQQLNEENILRQAISKKIFEQAEELLAAQEQIDTAIVLAKEGWHSGVIGIVASRLVDKYHLPTVLITTEGETAKASCRSIPPLNLYEALDKCKEHLQQFGGHHQAAGLTLSVAKIAAFSKAFKATVRSMLAPEDYTPKIVPDYFLPADKKISLQTVRDLSLLEPYGAENPFPIFAFSQATVTNFYLMGKEKTHLKLFLHHGAEHYKAVFWNEGTNKGFYYIGEEGTFVFAPKSNCFQGQESVDLHLLAIKPKRSIYDGRQDAESKDKTLKSILQMGQKTVIYVHDASELPDLGHAPRTCVLVYGTPLPKEDWNNVVFYGVPEVDVFSPQEFPLSGHTSVRLYLLYKNSELYARQERLELMYPNKKTMAADYRYLIGLIRAQSVVKVDYLLDNSRARDCFFTKEILRIFEELNFVAVENGQVTFKSSLHNDLSNSPTFCKMHKKYLLLKTLYQRAADIQPVMLARQWK